MHLQQARAVNVVFLGILETVTDDYNRIEHRLQLEGARTGRELPAVVDQVITITGSISATACSPAASSAPHPTSGITPPRTAAAGSSNSRSRTSASYLRNSRRNLRAATWSSSKPPSERKVKVEPCHFDFNTAGEQRTFDVVPDRTIAVVQLNIRPGDAGEDGLSETL